MSDEAAIDNEIQAKGLNAPRLTPALIDSTIVAEQYHTFPGTTLTVCALTLRNGFNVTGESAAASPENFDEEIGRKIARGNARQKIWAFEGYLLRETLAQADPGALDARLDDVDAIAERAGLFKAKPMPHAADAVVSTSDALLRDTAENDQMLRQWAFDRAFAVGIKPAPLIFKLAQHLFDFVKSGAVPAAEKAAD